MTDPHNSPEQAIEKYHHGFISNSPETVLAALGEAFIMVNGNHSGEPTDWQAHMFLKGADREAWPGMFLEEAGPYENKYEVLHTDIRGEAAVIVTRDTGKNRFRSWDGELVTWFLGKRDDGWKLVSMFIRDISNPE